jgi:hypothetical protein
LLLEILQTAPGVRWSVELSDLILDLELLCPNPPGWDEAVGGLCPVGQHCCTTWQQLEDLEDGAEDARRPAIVGFNGVVVDGCVAEPSTLLPSASISRDCAMV